MEDQVVVLEGAQSRKGDGWRMSYLPHVGHPNEGKGDWDICLLEAMTEEIRDHQIKIAEKQYWEVWIRGLSETPADDTHPYGAALYKPHGAQCRWRDPGPADKESVPLWDL